ncbi:MAG: porin [Candidatus Saccharibacteria bacterium]|nr:porin [Moraxellaceae bacterium]
MKKLLLATLVSTLSIGAAQAEGPTLYGKINVSVDSIKDDLVNGRTTKVDSNASRFGVKGSEKLTDNWSALYGIEWEVSVDGNSGADLGQRNRYVGLQYDGVGAVKLGRLDTNLKTAQNEVDIFNDVVDGNLDMKKTLAGEDRINNVIAFETAKFNLDGFGTLQGNLMVAPGEKSVAKGSVGATGVNSIVSGSGVYTNKDLGLYTAVAFDRNAPQTLAAVSTFKTAPTISANAALNIWRLVGSVDLTKAGVDGVSVNALVQQAKGADSKTFAGGFAPKETSFLVSGVYKFPASVLDGLSAKIQYQQSNTDFGGATKDVKIQQLGGDIDYAFSTKTKVFGYYAKRDLKNPNNPAVSTNGKDQNYAYSVFGLGMEQKF